MERADGVPLFMEELTKSVIEADGNEIGFAGAASPAPPAISAVPVALYGPLAARLDRLGAAKQIAQLGAVIGREFSYKLLAGVADRTDQELQSALNRLVEAGLIFRQGIPPNATFLVKHALVQDAAYSSLLRSQHKALHGHIVQALESQFPETAETQPELLAQHCAQADVADRAIDYWAKAGQKAIARSAIQEAAAHVRKALELLPHLPDAPARSRQELDLQLALGTALTSVKGYTAPETGYVYERARRLCEQLGDKRQLIRATGGQCNYHIMRAELDPALRISTDLLRRAETEEDIKLSLAAHRLIGVTVFQAGLLQQARYHLETAADLLRTAAGAANHSAVKDSLVVIPAYRSIVLALLGHYEEAKTQSMISLAEAERQARPHRRAFALAMGCWFHMTMNEDAPALLGSLEALSAEQKFTYWTGYALLFRGMAFARAAQVRQAIVAVKEGAALPESIGGAWAIPHFTGALAEFVAGSEGQALIDAALTRVESTGVGFL